MLSQRLYLLREMVWRDFQGRYAGSTLGLVWSFVPMLFQLALFSFVFSTLLHIPSGSQAPFALVLFAGLLPWFALQEGVQRAASAVVDNANLVKRLRFPTELLVLTPIAAAFLHQAVALLVFSVLLALLGHLSLGSSWLLLLALPLQLVLSGGLGLLCAAGQVFFRDLAPTLGVVFMAWFYLTPIVYPAMAVPERWRTWLAWNPLTPLVGLYRRALLGDGRGLPEGTLLLLGTTLLMAGAGLLVFERSKRRFPDEV